jgi:hypothetical protein
LDQKGENGAMRGDCGRMTHTGWSYTAGSSLGMEPSAIK